MKRELIPYYISRAILSALLGVFFVVGGQPWWAGLLVGSVTFAGFLWYAHSGFYLIDPSQPLTPLRRDARGMAIRDRAVVIAVVVGGVGFALLTLARLVVPLPPNLGTWALLAGVITYFVVSTWLYARG